jgi:predicted protein tyrosine phosphatase
VSADLLEWADRVFVMEQSQRRYLNAHFARSVKDKKIVCLNIADRYGYMQPELVTALRAKAPSAVASVEKPLGFEFN